MRLPQSNAAYNNFVRYGRYVARRLRRAGLESLAADAETSTKAVRTSGRAWEDADDAIQDALADRDGADDDLDLAAQTARTSLAGRGVNAEREAPYVDIFPKGIAYYTAAPLDENARRYGELRARLEEHLPAADATRKTAVAAIKKGAEAFDTASRALDEAETAERMAGTKARSALRAFERQMEKTYGALLVEVGKTAAERFFPRTRAAAAEGAAKPDPEPAPTP